MTAAEIYQTYNIPPNLRQHHYWVAGVALWILDHWHGTDAPDHNLITSELLLHDLGNVIKFDLENYFHLLGESEKGKKEYWQNAQKEFITQWGPNEHVATENIMKDIGVRDEVVALFNRCGSSKAKENTKSGDWSEKICTYADIRVAPHAIVSVDERWDEVLERYRGRGHSLGDIEEVERRRTYTGILEEQIQTRVTKPLSEISTTSITSYIEKLPSVEIV